MPDYGKIESLVPQIEELVGTPKVNADDIAARFPGAYSAVDIVNGYNGELLKNVAFVINSKDPDSFGIFNPSLNKTIDWLRVRDELSKRGFVTDIPDDPKAGDKLYAYHPGKKAEEVTQEMKSLFEQKESAGGTVIEVNTDNILGAADKMVKLKGNESLTPQQQNDLKTVQLASIIGHEALHARGGDEAACQTLQNNILEAGVKSLNVPVEFTGGTVHASQMNWYRKAQVAPFQGLSIEPVLRSVFEGDVKDFPVDRKSTDSLETVLIKNLHTNDEENIKAETVEGNLSNDRSEPDALDDKAVTTEELLQRTHTKPLILPIPKKSELESSMVKTAAWGSNIGGAHVGGVFGYMCGFNDAWIMPFEANEIGESPKNDATPDDKYWRRRYDPRYGKGAYAKDRFGRLTWKMDFQINVAEAEFRNRPTLWKDRPSPWPGRPDVAVAQTNTGKDYEVDTEKNYAIGVIKKIGYCKNLILAGKRKATRLLIDEKALPTAMSAVSDFPYMLFSNKKHDDTFVLWVVGDVSFEEIKSIEEKINSKTDLETVNSFVGLNGRILESVNKIFSKCRIIARAHALKDVFVVGGFCRTLATDKSMLDVNDLDFTSPYPDDCLKLGGLLAEDLGIGDIGYLHRTNTMTLEYEGIDMDFRGKFIPYDVVPLMREAGISITPLHFDVYARDFTINSLLYSFLDNRIYDVTSRGMRDIQAKQLVTFFPPEKVLPASPLIITRGIILNMRGYQITPELDRAMKTYGQCLFDGKLSNERLAYEYEKIAGYEDGMYMLEEYGIQRLKDIRDKVAKEQPELFEES